MKSLQEVARENPEILQRVNRSWGAIPDTREHLWKLQDLFEKAQTTKEKRELLPQIEQARRAHDQAWNAHEQNLRELDKARKARP